MNEKLESLKRCLKDAAEMERELWYQLRDLPCYDEVDAERVKLQEVIDDLSRHNMDYDDWEKDLSDLMAAHPDYALLFHEREKLIDYYDDIHAEIVRMGYEWDASVQDFVRKAA